MLKWKVYIHTVPNGKKYVGITSKEPEERWRINGNGYYNHKYFYNAILKYGWDNIKHEVIYENLSESEAKNKERELIKKLNSSDRSYGYNLTLGGDGRVGKGLVSDEQKQKLQVAVRGKNTFLTEGDVYDIKTQLLDGKSRREVADLYKLTNAHLSALINGKNWGYVMPEFVEQFREFELEKETKLETKVINFYKKNRNISKTAKALGIGYSRARTILIKAGFDMNAAARAQEIMKKVVDDYGKGLTKKQIIKKYNITPKLFNNYTAGMTKRKLDTNREIERKKMCRLREQGYTIKEIAKMFNCHRCTVSEYTKEHMLELKKADAMICYKLFDAGYSKTQIAKKVGRDIDFVKNWLNKRGEVCSSG